MSEYKAVGEKLKNGLSGDNLDNALDFIVHMTKIGMMVKNEYHPRQSGPDGQESFWARV